MLSATTWVSNQSLHKGSNFLPCCTRNEVRGSREPAALFPCLPMHSSQTELPTRSGATSATVQSFPCHWGATSLLQKHLRGDVQPYFRRSHSLSGQPPCLMLHLRRTMSITTVTPETLLSSKRHLTVTHYIRASFQHYFRILQDPSPM